MNACSHAAGADVDAAVRPATPAERSSLQLPPGPKGRFESVLPWVFSYPRFAERLQRRYGDIVRFRLPGRDCCLVCDPVLAAGVLANEGKLFSQGGASVKMPRMPNQGLQALHGEAHRWRWEILRPAFTDENLDAYEDIFAERLPAMQDQWRHGRDIDMFEEMARLMSAINVTIFFGRDMDPPLDIAFNARPPLKWDLVFNNLPVPPTLLRKLLPLRSIREGDGVLAKLDDLIERAIERSREPSFEGRDLITRMVRGRAGNDVERGFTDDEIHDDAYMILVGGVGPTSTTVCWCLQYLAENPASRERLEREVDEVLGGKPIAAFDQTRLPYAHAVLKEGLRLAPPTYFIDKFAVEDCAVGDYLIPKGTWVWPAAGMVHRKAEHFERPHEFRPERWIEGAESELPPHAYWPYGYGYRTCLGEEYGRRVAVYCLASFAQRWRLDPVSRRPVWPKYVLAGPYNKWGSWRMRLTRRPLAEGGAT